MDAKERQEKIRQAILQTLSEPGITKLSFPKIRRAVNARIPEVHRYFRDALLTKGRDWDLELHENLKQLGREDKVELSGVDDYQLKIGKRGFELGGLNED